MLRLLATFGLLHWAGALSAATLEELRSAYVYNFAQFVSWPEEAPGTFDICVASAAQKDELQRLDGRTVRQMAMRVRQAMPDSGAASCRIVVLSAGALGTLDKWRVALGKRPVLLIATGEQAAALGAGVGLFANDDGHLGFDLNLEAIENLGLRVSSRLLPLARKVY